MTRSDIVAFTVAEMIGKKKDSDEVKEIVAMVRASKPSEKWDKELSLREVEDVNAAFKEEAQAVMAFLDKKTPDNILGMGIPPELVKKLFEDDEE